jgi:lipopolysaccharide biosynthesis glycosyltransferase
MKRLRISLLFCADGPYFQHLGAAIASVLRANPGHDFEILVCSEARQAQEEEKISAIASRFKNASITFLEFNIAGSHGQQLRLDRYLTMASYLRLFLTEFLSPTIEKVLYLDCDIIVNGDIGELWETDLGEAYLAATPEPYFAQHPGFERGDTYISAGVLLINVARWRAENVLPRFLQFATEHAAVLTCHDQDVLNNVFKGRIRFLDYRWNFQTSFADMEPENLKMDAATFREVRSSPPIVHFTGKYKPWFYKYRPHYKGLYYEALAATAWKDYRPPDRTLRAIVRKLITLQYVKERVNWYAPGLANSLRRMLGKRSRLDIDPTIA